MPILVSLEDVTPEPPVYESPTTALDVEWLDANGRRWLLTDPASPVRLLSSPRGFGWGDVDRWTSEAPALAGSRYRGYRAKAREVFLPLQVREASSAAYVATRRAWNRGLSLDVEGTLVARVLGEERYLPCRHLRSEDSFTSDPVLAAKAVVGEYLEAGGAFWQGPRQQTQYGSGGSADFFMTSGGVFFISPANLIGSATLSNPGDEPAWLTWTLEGPWTSITIGVAGQTIEVPFPMAAGQFLVIETAPDRQTVVDQAGDSRVGSMGQVGFAPLPPLDDVPLSITASGTDAGFAVTAAFTPLYRRAW